MSPRSTTGRTAQAHGRAARAWARPSLIRTLPSAPVDPACTGPRICCTSRSRSSAAPLVGSPRSRGVLPPVGNCTLPRRLCAESITAAAGSRSGRAVPGGPRQTEPSCRTPVPIRCADPPGRATTARRPRCYTSLGTRPHQPRPTFRAPSGTNVPRAGVRSNDRSARWLIRQLHRTVGPPAARGSPTPTGRSCCIRSSGMSRCAPSGPLDPAHRRSARSGRSAGYRSRYVSNAAS